MGFECVERTHVGLRRRLNEDAVACVPAHAIWAVADGMGGHEAGEVASARVVEALAALPPSPDLDGRAGSAVLTLQTVNDELVAMARQETEHRTIGSTVVGLIIGNGQYRCFWAGDSRAYRVRGGGITQLTRDHSLVQGLLDAGVIDAAEAANHPNSNVVTRAVGAAETLDVAVVGDEVHDGDIFLLASDGLTRVVSQVEILAAIYHKQLEQAADSLIELVLSRGAPDNVTLVIVRSGFDAGTSRAWHSSYPARERAGKPRSFALAKAPPLDIFYQRSGRSDGNSAFAEFAGGSQ